MNQTVCRIYNILCRTVITLQFKDTASGILIFELQDIVDIVYRLGMVQSRISNAKNALVTWKAYEQSKELMQHDIDSKVPLLREIYKRNQNRRAVWSPVMAAIRSCISRAALLVKVSARIL